MTEAQRPRSGDCVEQAEELRIDVDGLALAAKVWGPTDGLPVLALHGWLDNAATFDALAPLLPEARWVALDLPGHGLSAQRGAYGTYHMIDWLPAVAAVRDALGWKRPVLLGHSMGAAVVSLLAGAQPERTSRVVLLEGLGPLVSGAEEMPARVGRYLEERARERRGTRSPIYSSEAEVSRSLRRAMGNISAEGARALLSRGLRPLPDGGVTWRSDRRLRGTSPMRLTEAQVRAFLRGIAAPVLLVRALQGLSFDPQTMAERRACIDRLEMVEVQGGHHVHLDDPHGVARAIHCFLFGR